MKNPTKSKSKKTTKPAPAPVEAPAPKVEETPAPVAKEENFPVVPLPPEPAKIEQQFLQLLAVNAEKGPIPFKQSHRDFKRQNALFAVASVSEIKFGAKSEFKDEKDLYSMIRWVLRCRERIAAGTMDPKLLEK